MKKTKILLIYPSQFYSPFWGKRRYVKNQLFSLYSFLKYHQVAVDVLDLENEIGRPGSSKEIKIFEKKASECLSRYRFNIAAISCWSSLSYLSSINIAALCKRIDSKNIVVVGGYHPSALPEDFLYEKSPFDYIVRGEGEISLLDICRNKEKVGPLPRLIHGKLLNLNDGVKLYLHNYKYSSPYKESSIYLSRGCCFSCAFCMEPCKGDGKWRAQPVADSIKKIKALIKNDNPRLIYIYDACFGFSGIWRKEFLAELIRNKINKVFWIETRPDLLDKEDIDLFAELNFVIQIGLDSGSPRMLSIMNKTRNPGRYLEHFSKVLSYMNEREVPYKINLIFNHPGETRQTYQESISFLRDLFYKQKKLSGLLVGQNYAFFPGTDIYYNLKEYEDKYGVVIAHKAWWKEEGDHAILSRNIMPSKDLKDYPASLQDWQQSIRELNNYILTKSRLWNKIFRYERMMTF